MQKLTESIVETAEWVPGQTRTIDIDLAGYITEIVFRINLNLTRASGAGAIVEDGIMRLIRGLRFTASNVKDWYTIRDGREGFYLSYLKLQGHVFHTAVAAYPAEGEAGDVELQFVFHPGVLPGNMFDITRCVPLRGKSNVQVEIDWNTPAADVLGAGWTVDADIGGLEVDISRVVLEKGESEADAFAPLDHIFVPRLIPNIYDIGTNTWPGFAFSRDVPTGAYIRDVMLLIFHAPAEGENLGVRSDAEVTQFRVANNKGGLFHVRRNWLAYTREVAARYYLTAPVTGLGIVDFRNVTGKDYGLNMVQASKGDWMIDFTIPTNQEGEIRALYEGADLVSVDPTEVGTGVR